MINLELLSWLEKEGLVDRRFVVWWQKGFEGRRVFSESDFQDGLVSIEYEAYFDYRKIPEKRKRVDKVWFRDEVPILLRKLSLDGKEIPVFVSVKPMSHDHYEGWRTLTYIQDGSPFPLEIFFKPHIRGIVLEDNADFLFWMPFGRDPSYYSGALDTYFFEGESLPVIFDPIHPTKFYQNLIERGWSGGRRAQKRPEEFNGLNNGFKIVPYYLFRNDQKHLTVYPAPIFDGKLDFPIIIRGGKKIPEILGTGYFSFQSSTAIFWQLDSQKLKKVKNSLIDRLGHFNNPSFEEELSF